MKLIDYFNLNKRVERMASITTYHADQGYFMELDEAEVDGEVDREAQLDKVYPQTTVPRSEQPNKLTRRLVFFSVIWQFFFKYEEGQMSVGEQLLMSLGILIGVYFSAAIRGDGSQVTILIAAVIALMIIPVAFEKLSINPKAPFIVRFGLFVQNGVFWNVLFEALGKSLSD